MAMLRFLLILLALVICSPGQVLAATEIVSVEATGRGIDREEAINAALVEALGSVEGIEILSRRSLSSSSSELMIRGANGSESQIVLDRNSVNSVRTATEGFVEGFNVLGARDIDGQVEIRLEARIATFKAPGAATQTTRRRIAVYPVDVRGSHTFMGSQYGSQELQERLTQGLVEAMTGTRRFAVLERSRANAIEAELAFLRDPAVARIEATRIGQAVGADYLLTARLVDLNVTAERHTSRLTGETTTQISGAIAMDMRIVSTATRQIMWADTEVIRGRTLSEVGSLNDALMLVAQRLTKRAVDAIYPMRIVSVSSNGDVVVNQGSNRLARGDRLDVFVLGDHLKDPYSGESLGREETQVGTIEVTRVTSKVGYAVSIEPNGWLSDAGASEREYVVRDRRAVNMTDGTQGVQGNAPPVLLPQDIQ